MIWRFSCLAFLVLALPSASLAQGTDPLVVTAGTPVPLAGAQQANHARTGDSYLIPFAVENRSDRPISQRRIAFLVPEGLDLVDPTTDGIDNDRNGIVDDASEGFDRVDDATIAWRLDLETPSIAPGDRLERAIKLRVLPTAEAGATLPLAIVAAAVADDTTLRARAAVPVSLDPPILDLTLDGTTEPQSFIASDQPRLRAAVSIPSGRLVDLTLTVKGSPAVDGYREARVLVGKAVRCDAPAVPTVEARSLVAVFGTCKVDGTAPAEDRRVAIEAAVSLRDAEPFSGLNVIDARRAIRFAAIASRGETPVVPPRTVAGRLTGPLIGARLLRGIDKGIDAGDAISATWRLVNRGDAVPDGLVLRLIEDGTVDCLSLAIKGEDVGANGCVRGIDIAELAPGAQRDLSVSLSLRDDADLSGDGAVETTLTAANMADTPMPPVAYGLRLPPAPDLAIEEEGDWTVIDGLVTARIGDAGTIRITGTLPEGRYDGSLRLLSRLVDAQTGIALAPAPLAVEAFGFAPADPVSIDARDVDTTVVTEEGWTVVSLPLASLSVPISENDDDKAFAATATLRLRDAPDFEAGRLLEIAAQLDLPGAKLRSETWIETLIVEPALDLTVRSPDIDRAIDLHESAQVAVLSCNHGDAPAMAVVLTARLPDDLVVDASDPARVRTISTERVAEGKALFSPKSRAVGEAFYETPTGTLRGVLDADRTLEADTCLAMIFRVRRAETGLDSAGRAEIRAGVEPYRGRTGTDARIYPGQDTGSVRFDLPPLRFGPVSEQDLGGTRVIAHDIMLEIPRSAGPHRLDLSAKSSDGLDWTILRVDEDDAATPWRNGTVVPAGEVIRFRFETPNPGTLPLGWIDTTLVRALAFSETGKPFAATSRLVTRRGEAPGGRISVTKTMALDRDCDGDVADERIQDALFEPVKDASVGDCVIFRVRFQHTGDRSMERIVVRDTVPAGTELRPDAVEILRTPQPLQDSEMTSPRPGTSDVVWSFEGLFEPGAEGEVSYAVKLTGAAAQ